MERYLIENHTQGRNAFALIKPINAQGSLWNFDGGCEAGIHYSPEAEGPAEPGTCSIVTAGEARWWPIIPVAVERGVPFQVTEQLDVKGCVGVYTNTAGIGNCGQESEFCVETGFAEPEKLCFRSYQCCAEILLMEGNQRLFIRGTLPRGSSNKRDAHTIGIPKISPDSSSKCALQ